MKLSKTDRKHILRALEDAIKTRDALIDAHRYLKCRRNQTVMRCVPPEYRKDVEAWKRQIATWEKLIKKIQSV